MKGYFIYNKYLLNHKFNTLREYFFIESKRSNVELEFIDNSNAIQMFLNNRMEKKDFVLFWDKDIKLAKLFEQEGYLVMNNSRSIEICDDKAKTYIELYKHNINQPLTIISPLTYYTNINDDSEFIDCAINKLGFPMIVKECYGSFGEQVYLCNDKNNLNMIINQIGCKPFILQEFIKTSYGRDIRIEIIGGKVVAAVCRKNENNDFRANITNGAIASKYNPSKEQIDISIKACDVLNLDFAGVDILFGVDDKPILCEINSNAYPINVQNITGTNIVAEILNYIKNKIS